jgi:hypothetical protein
LIGLQGTMFMSLFVGLVAALTISSWWRQPHLKAVIFC